MPESISEDAKDLLAGMIDYKNDKRMTFKECLQHPWFVKPSNKKINLTSIGRLKEFKK